MSYVGRAAGRRRHARVRGDLRDQRASLQIGVPEFEQLVRTRSCPAVTTAALLQGLYVRGRIGFEATVLAMNTRYGTLPRASATTPS